MALTDELRWYARRLRVMGPGEIAHRLREQWTLQRLRLASRPGSPPLATGPSRPADAGFCRDAGAPQCRLPLLPFAAVADLAEGPAGLLAGRWPALGFPWQWTASPETWQRAPDTGARWPRQYFASIPHRAGNPYGDVRVAWEPARLQQLVSLARLARADAAGGTGAAAIRLLEDQLLSFVAANPPLTGIHYLSAMECALRLIAVCHALDLVRDRLTRPDAVWTALLSLVASHAGYIERRLSLHSSAGNHTIAEAAGLVYAGTLFPEFHAAARWQARGLGLLTEEARRQILDDGGGLEQAFWYLLFITDLCGLVLALLAHRGEPAPAGLAERVALGRQFLGALAAAPADLPPVGDRDDGYALSPALRLSFAAPNASAPGNSLATPDRPAGPRTFPAAGYTLWRSAGPVPTEVLFDHGPLGMAPAFGHGHADALSVTLRRHGRDLLVDPGTFTYTGPARWRSHFRSTAAHNTVTVDGADQAIQQAAFLWSGPFRCELVRAAQQGGVFRALARHDGYARLGGNIVHWRGLALRDDGQATVWDWLDGEGLHTVELVWNVGVRASLVGACWLLGADTMLEIAGGTTTTCREGATDPPAGWRSRVYGTKEPIVTLRTHWRGQLPHELVTRIFPRAPVLPDGAMPDRAMPDGTMPDSQATSAIVAEDLDVFKRWR